MLQLIKSQKGVLSKQEATDVEHFKRLETLENEQVGEERIQKIEESLQKLQADITVMNTQGSGSEIQTIEERIKALEDEQAATKQSTKSYASTTDLKQSVARLEHGLTQKLTKELGRISATEKAIEYSTSQLKSIEEKLTEAASQ